MTPEVELAKLVLAMRNHQKQYFRTKQGLDQCKAAERSVDNAVAALLAEPDLFSPPPEKIARKYDNSGSGA